MEPITIEHLKYELVSGIKKRNHPFRFFYLSTVDNLNQPQTRTVVLRNVNEELELFFFTDMRSHKVQQIQDNPKVSALFYHPEKLLQLRLNGHASLITEEAITNTFWKSVPEASKRDYSTSHGPGRRLTDPEELTYLEGDHHFSVIKVVPASIGYLRLQHPHHQRVLYTKVAGQWVHEFLVP